MRKASVLPLPVFAAPKMSSPASARPIHCFCISVGTINLFSRRAFLVFDDRGKSSNVLIFVASIYKFNKLLFQYLNNNQQEVLQVINRRCYKCYKRLIFLLTLSYFDWSSEIICDSGIAFCLLLKICTFGFFDLSTLFAIVRSVW